MRKLYFLVLGLLIFSGVNAQIVNIPDVNFKARLLDKTNSAVAIDLLGKDTKVDANNDGEIQISEAQNLLSLNLSYANISSLEGISSFTNLIELICYRNNLTSLDLSSLVKLRYLECQYNKLPVLNINKCTDLIRLICSYNNLATLDLSNNINLKAVAASRNQFSTIDLSSIIDLRSFDLSYNKLTSIIFPRSISESGGLVNNNLLETIELPQGNVSYFYFNDNPNLSSIFLKNLVMEITNEKFYASNNGKKIFSNCPKLKYVCADVSQINDIKKVVLDNGYLDCEVNSYCSFVPGGTYFTIKGNTKLDSNTNGCDESDLNYPNLKFTITDGINSGNFTSNTTGSYAIPVQAGVQTITPVLENPGYFNYSPTNAVVTFPAQTSQVTQDFCITPNGVHHDVEITVLSMNRARPGFDTTYKIVYKNKGTQTQSGSVNLIFNDAVLDLISTNPAVTTQSAANLSWNFSDLKPFETREIEVKFNVNSPMETPAVNIDDILSYTATITSPQTDETPLDNTFVLNQTVVGSFDPNDKTCLEGATIPPSVVGKYVHYLIRFENKGTAEAQNVVVKDMIDTSKFDVNSLVVTQGSHPFVTRISETNKVEFIFENINLPFDDATNDGYVAFKIKTKPSLVVGDSFSNTASIYFDYNFPIVTNTATTSVLQSLGNIDFEFDSYFSVYPNPAKNSLNVDIKKQIKVSSISIYNTLGQQILVIPNAQYTKQVDVSNLKTGNYFIKLTSDKGSSVGKFIKS